MSHVFWIGESDLDNEQRKAVQGISQSESFLLRGPAGSGKTNILLLRAKWLKLKKISALRIIVFTSSLRTFVQKGCEQYGIPKEDVTTGNQFFRDLLEEYNVDFEKSGNFETDRSVLAGKVNALLEAQGIENIFDCLLIDEAQDYTDTELLVYRKLTSRLVMAADSRQSIYRTTHTAGMLDGLVDSVVTLKYHYRSGLNICKVADTILKDSSSYPSMHGECKYDEVAKPSLVTLVPCPTFQEQMQAILKKLAPQLGLYPGETIGVMFPKREQKLEFIDALSSYDLPDKERIWVDTLHGAKGWEFRAAHIGGCEALYKMGATQKRLAYTGILRARTSVTLYCTGNVPGYLESAVAAIAPPEADPGMTKLFES